MGCSAARVAPAVVFARSGLTAAVWRAARIPVSIEYRSMGRPLNWNQPALRFAINHINADAVIHYAEHIASVNILLGDGSCVHPTRFDFERHAS